MKLTAFVDAAARELQLLPMSWDFRLVNGMTSAFSFPMRRRRHEVDEEVHELRGCGRGD